MKKYLYIIAGCNGAGKTTASYTILPEILKVKEFVNADEIAKGLSPFRPEKVSFEAGRIMLKRIDELLEHQENFAFETTLSTKSYKQRVIKAQQKGYCVVLLFFWLRDVRLAIERVRIRVQEGGHHIPNSIIRRRYKRGIVNFNEIFKNLVNEWMLFDNSEGLFDLIAAKEQNEHLFIVNEFKFKSFNKMTDADI